MKRVEFTTKIKVAAFERAKGRCEECTSQKIIPQYDHRVPLAMGGESTLANCVVLCRTCHKLKTTTQDVPRIAKSKRIEAKHIGAVQPKGKIQSAPFWSNPKPDKSTRVAAAHQKHMESMNRKAGHA